MDRGFYSVETFLLLLALKVRFFLRKVLHTYHACSTSYIYPGGRGRLQGKHWSSHHCQYDVTFRLNEIQNGAQSGIRRDVRKCRIFVGKTDSFTVIGNGKVSTIFS